MRAVCLLFAGGALLASAGNAAAQLLPPLPPPPDLGGTIGDVTGLLGGSGSQPPADGGTGGGSGGASGGSGATSAGSGGTSTGAGATTTGSGGSESAAPAGGSSAGAPAPADVRAPRVSLRVVSGFAWVARTGRLKARVTTDEPGSVTVGGTLRVGRRIVRLEPVATAYPTAGAKTVTLALPRAARHRLARVRSVRVSLQAVGLDASRNRAFTALKRTLTRPHEVAHLRHRHRGAARRAVEGPR